MAIHGCTNHKEYFKDFDNFVRESAEDYLKYAASNELIILYPAVQVCWDINGYTNDKYSSKYGI